MKKAILSLAGMLVALVWSLSAFPLAIELPPGRPVGGRSPLADLLNSGGRVYGISGFGATYHYFSGDTKDFNRFLEGYAKLEGSARTLVLHPEQGSVRALGGGDESIAFDWRVTIWRVGGAAARGPLLELWVGRHVELSEVKVPGNVSVGSDGRTPKETEIEEFIAANKAESKKTEEGETPPAVEITASDEAAKPGPLTPTEPKLTISATFNSKRLLYGKLALNEDRSKVLSMVLDESKGTRTGHDLLYADVNFNGTFEESEKLTAVTVKRYGSWLSSSTFAPLNFDVPYNQKGSGIADSCQLTLGYRQYPRAGVAEDFSVTMKIRLRQGSTVWDYSVNGSVQPSKRLEDPDVWTLPGPRMTVSTQPDKNKKGHLGIALNVSAGEGGFGCRREGQPVEAHIEVRKPDGEIVHRGDATPDKFRFG
jgi:hypothetical protein